MRKKAHRRRAHLRRPEIPAPLLRTTAADSPAPRRLPRRRRCLCSTLQDFACSSPPVPSKMVSFEMNDLKKIGLGLTGFGVFFSFLGIVFFFDKGLIAMGNILFLSGLGLTIGLKSTMQFFTKPKNYKGTISFGAGFFLVLIGWPFFGMLLEAYGFVVLFSGFWPTLAVFLQRIPILGWIFQQPFVTSFLDRYRGKRVPV
ncbi:hypothetical protein ZWY2020_007523 [Hordeum vulgare]|nr:hypothetical protein ZWY2020_007523 [Hordeum vulgare]